MSMVRAKYDREADAIYLRLSDQPVARTAEVTDMHMVDLDANGVPVGIEILDPSDPRLEEIAARFGLLDSLLALRNAVDASMADTSTFGSADLIVYFTTAASRAEKFSIPAYMPLVPASASGMIVTRPIEKLVLEIEE
jgi:uncharacterized protein YuzE